MSTNSFDINRKLWNEKTEVHFKFGFYDGAGFLGDASSLNSIELELLGAVAGKSLLHLQCHFGMDLISLSRLGANVVGVDFSENAIHKARELAGQMQTNTRFIKSDIYQLEDKLDSQFDIVFTSYGAIGWLPDMNEWARMISRFLKPGGMFVMVEFHPIVWMFSYDFSKIEYGYFNTGAIVEEIVGTYADRTAPLKNTSVSWNHSLSEVFGALMENGLNIDRFEEHNYSPHDCFDKIIEKETNKYQIPGLENKIPMLYSIRARK